MKKIILVLAVVMIAVVLTSLVVGCTDNANKKFKEYTAEEYKTQLEKRDYDVDVEYSSEEYNLQSSVKTFFREFCIEFEPSGGVEFFITAYKNDDSEGIFIIRFEKSSDADLAIKKVKKEAKAEDFGATKVMVEGRGHTIKITFKFDD